ncbi:hypothetical protein J1N35_004716, partial [Gossypium stocksii]
EKKTKQHRRRRPRRPYMNFRLGVHALIEFISSKPTSDTDGYTTSYTIWSANVDNNNDVFAIFDNSNILSAIELCDTIHLSVNSVTNAPYVIVLSTDNRRWKPRMTQHSSTEERKEDDDDEDEEPQLQRSPPRNRHPPGYGTHLARRCR